MHSAARAGSIFVVLFVAAFVVSVGDLVGSFADPDRVFVDRFADGDNRIKDIAGSYLLVLAGLAFVWFVHALSREAKDHRAPLLITGSAAAGGMIVAAVAWATVPMSLWFGSLVDDPGLQEGQAGLTRFGYVALALGGMLLAAAFIAFVARTPGLAPRWLSVVSYPIAALVAFTALLFMPVLLFILWVVAWRPRGGAEAVKRRSPTSDPLTPFGRGRPADRSLHRGTSTGGSGQGRTAFAPPAVQEPRLGCRQATTGREVTARAQRTRMCGTSNPPAVRARANPSAQPGQILSGRRFHLTFDLRSEGECSGVPHRGEHEKGQPQRDERHLDADTGAERRQHETDDRRQVEEELKLKTHALIHGRSVYERVPDACRVHRYDAEGGMQNG